MAGRDLTYTVRPSARARALSVAVHPDGRVIVTKPRRISEAVVELFIARHGRWIERAIERTRANRVIRLGRGDIARLKRRAHELALRLSSKYAALYGVEFKKITIRAQKRRWGSCSRAGNLNFNYKIAALPRDLAEYVIVHEVCHLRAFDHSPRFWREVERAVPDHRARRAALRRIVFAFV